MTVRELIEQLSKFEPDMKVVVDGYEEGYDDPVVCTAEILIDSNITDGRKDKHWSGRHSYVWREGERGTKVVRVGR